MVNIYNFNFFLYLFLTVWAGKWLTMKYLITKEIKLPYEYNYKNHNIIIECY